MDTSIKRTLAFLYSLYLTLDRVDCNFNLNFTLNYDTLLRGFMLFLFLFYSSILGMRFLYDVDLCTCSLLSVNKRYVCSSFCPFFHSSTIHRSLLFLFLSLFFTFFTIPRCQVEGCNRGFDSAPRLRRHMKIHNKGECDQIVWLFLERQCPFLSRHFTMFSGRP